MSGGDRSQEDIEREVHAVGQDLRDLKARLKSEGLREQDVNRHEATQALLAKLQALKALLKTDVDEAFFRKQRAEREEAKRQDHDLARSQEKELKAVAARLEQPVVQRKIFHLFRYAGNGDEFHYEPPPRLNDAQTSFGAGSVPRPSVYITEKWDGTTMQATSCGVFQRLDVWGRRRDGQDPSKRYDIRLLAFRDEASGSWRGLDFVGADKRYAEALAPYLERFGSLDEGLCVYFELVHTDVNARYKQLPGFADIRVFDFSRAGQFLPFCDTVALADRFQLPIVGWELLPQLDEVAVWSELSAAGKARRGYGVGTQHATATAVQNKLGEAELEGFVVREAGSGSRIAKARCEHVPHSNGRGRAGHAAPVRGPGDLSYLLEIGLPLVGH